METESVQAISIFDADGMEWTEWNGDIMEKYLRGKKKTGFDSMDGLLRLKSFVEILRVTDRGRMGGNLLYGWHVA